MMSLRLVLALLVTSLLCVSCSRRPGQENLMTNRRLFALQQSNVRRNGNVTVYTLQNGLTLLHEKKTTNAIVGVVMYIRAGSSDEEPNRAGLASLMMRLLVKGTASRTADQISEQLSLLGAALSPSAGRDNSKVSLQCVNEDFPEAMNIFADVILNPSFPLGEIALEKKKTLAQIRMGDDLNHVIGTKRFMRELFGTHPYGRPLEGDNSTVTAIEPGDFAALHSALFVPSNMVLCVVGNVDFEQTRATAEKEFGAIRLERKPSYSIDKLIAPGGSRSEIEKKSEQTFIALGHLTCATGDPDEPAVEIAAEVLGGGMSSRLFVELRDKQGLAYSVGASATFLKKQGYFVTHIGTAPANVKRATDGLWQQVERLRDEPITDEELRRAKNSIAGDFLRAHERNLQQANYLGYWYITGRPADYDAEYLRRINAVTTRDVMRIANKYFLEPTLVTVGPTLVSRPEPATP